MKKLFVLSLILAQVSHGYGSYSSSPTYTPPPSHSPSYSAPAAPVIPNNLQYGNQIYDGSLDGMREFLNDQKSVNPKLYSQLNGDLNEMESQARTASWIGWGGVGVGAGLMTFSFFAGGRDKYGLRKVSFGMLYGGLGVIVAGYIGALAYAPNRKDFLKFINKHNRLNPRQPLDLKLGLVPLLDDKGFALTAIARF